ncbi:hypothetical protein X766_12585 [Mesorhizobium sp. LSJC255A00]|nr:hypothetical protein X766_12585 [Mesorhizobium sp. LSJC255A00]
MAPFFEIRERSAAANYKSFGLKSSHGFCGGLPIMQDSEM